MIGGWTMHDWHGVERECVPFVLSFFPPFLSFSFLILILFCVCINVRS